jgi:hypothetical protein
VAAALSGCSSPASRAVSPEDLRQWASTASLEQTSDLITRYLAAIEQDRVHGTPGEVKFDCLGLRGQAVEGNSFLPSPDATVSKLLAEAYRNYYDFAAACIGAGGRSRDDPATSRPALAADRELGAALARYDTLTR